MSPTQTNRPTRVLCVASGGGHWVQLLRLRPAFDGCDVAYVCVRRSYAVDVPGSRFFAVNDATRWNKLALVALAARIAWIIVRFGPDVVVSTGAAPGYFALRIGRMFGAKTVWIDSIANVETMSKSGTIVRRHADLWLTQWPHLAQEGGPRFVGAVL